MMIWNLYSVTEFLNVEFIESGSKHKAQWSWFLSLTESIFRWTRGNSDSWGLCKQAPNWGNLSVKFCPPHLYFHHRRCSTYVNWMNRCSIVSLWLTKQFHHLLPLTCAQCNHSQHFADLCCSSKGNNQALLHPSRFLHQFIVFLAIVIVIAHIQSFWGTKAQTDTLMNLLSSRYPSPCPCHEGACSSSQDNLSQLSQQHIDSSICLMANQDDQVPAISWNAVITHSVP